MDKFESKIEAVAGLAMRFGIGALFVLLLLSICVYPIILGFLIFIALSVGIGSVIMGDFSHE